MGGIVLSCRPIRHVRMSSWAWNSLRRSIARLMDGDIATATPHNTHGAPIAQWSLSAGARAPSPTSQCIIFAACCFFFLFFFLASTSFLFARLDRTSKPWIFSVSVMTDAPTKTLIGGMGHLETPRETSGGVRAAVSKSLKGRCCKPTIVVEGKGYRVDGIGDVDQVLFWALEVDYPVV